MASYRLPDSILEAPELDFGGSWVDFFRILCIVFQESPPRIPPAIDTANNAKMLKGLRRLTICRVQTPRVRPRRSVLSQWPRPKRVGGGGPPRGVTIRRPPLGGAQRVRSQENLSNLNAKPDQLQMPNLITLSPGCPYTPL